MAMDIQKAIQISNHQMTAEGLHEELNRLGEQRSAHAAAADQLESDARDHRRAQGLAELAIDALKGALSRDAELDVQVQAVPAPYGR